MPPVLDKTVTALPLPGGKKKKSKEPSFTSGSVYGIITPSKTIFICKKLLVLRGKILVETVPN